MSLWYYHWLVVKDLAWTPTKRHAEQIHQVLVKWGLTDVKPKLQDMAQGKLRSIRGSQVVSSGEIPANLLMTYPSATIDPSRNMLGPHHLEEAGMSVDGEVWVRAIHIALGEDYKVFAGDYCGVVCEVIEPPRRGSKTVSVHRKDVSCLSSQIYPTDARTSPPKVRIHRHHEGQNAHWGRDFTGVWRSGLMLDCYQYVPAFAMDPGKKWELPLRAFVRDLERAFETRLVQAGLFG